MCLTRQGQPAAEDSLGREAREEDLRPVKGRCQNQYAARHGDGKKARHRHSGGSPRLDQIIDLKHALVKLAQAIDWRFLEGRFGEVYTDKPGQPPLPTRLMAGLAIIKHMHNLSDEALRER